MSQLRLLIYGLLIILTVSQRFRGLLLGLTVLAVNELVHHLLRLEGPGRIGRRGRSWLSWLGERARRSARSAGTRWPRLPQWLAPWLRLPRWLRLPQWLRRRRWTRVGAFSSYDRILGDIAWARYSQRDFDVGLRRRLLAAARMALAEGRGVDLDRNPAAARRLLGDETWAVLAPDRPASEDRGATGVDLPELERVVASIEALRPAPTTADLGRSAAYPAGR